MQSVRRVRLVFPELELRAWQKSEINSPVVCLGDWGGDGAVGRCDSRNSAETPFDARLMLC